MKKKVIISVLVIVVLCILFVPMQLLYDDGGTVEYKALTYSVHNYHTIEGLRGTEVKILGITVYDGTYAEEFYKILGHETVGVIKDYDSNDELDVIKKTILTRHINNLKGDATFISVQLIGEENGKKYVQATYESYEKQGDEIKRIDSESEIAEFEEPTDSDYKSISGQEAILKRNEFLPESMAVYTNSETFDEYVYTYGKAREEIQQQVNEYFELEERNE